MSNFEPPDPGRGRFEPPPPNWAQQLSAAAGFVVYEGGRSVFDEPVLVYRAKPKRQWPGFDITDHVGRYRAVIVADRPRRMSSTLPCTVCDPGNSVLFRINPRRLSVNSAFDVTGVATARLVARSRRITVETGSERLGTLRGTTFRGIAGDRLTILDDRSRPVAMVRSFKRGGIFDRVEDFVLSFDRHCTGPLRNLAVTLPAAIVMARRAQGDAAAL